MVNFCLFLFLHDSSSFLDLFRIDIKQISVTRTRHGNNFIYRLSLYIALTIQSMKQAINFFPLKLSCRLIPFVSCITGDCLRTNIEQYADIFFLSDELVISTTRWHYLIKTFSCLLLVGLISIFRICTFCLGSDECNRLAFEEVKY